MTYPQFKINKASSNSQCRVGGEGGVKTITISNRYRSDTKIDVCEKCLKIGLDVIRYGTYEDD